jgi:hypothetical protein
MGLVFLSTLNILTILPCKPYFCLRSLLASSDSESLAFLISPSVHPPFGCPRALHGVIRTRGFFFTFYLSRVPISSYIYLSMIYNKPYGGLYGLTVFSIGLKVNVLLIRELCYLVITIAAHCRRSNVVTVR